MCSFVRGLAPTVASYAAFRSAPGAGRHPTAALPARARHGHSAQPPSWDARSAARRFHRRAETAGPTRSAASTTARARTRAHGARRGGRLPPARPPSTRAKARRPGARLGVQRLPGLGRAGIGQPQAPAIAQQGVPPHRDPLLLRQGIAGRRAAARRRNAITSLQLPPRAGRQRQRPPERHGRIERPLERLIAAVGIAHHRIQPRNAQRAQPQPLQAHAVGDGEVGKRGGRLRIRRAAAKTRAQRIGRQHAGMARIQRGAGPQPPGCPSRIRMDFPPTGASACWLPEMPCSSSTTARACAGSGP